MTINDTIAVLGVYTGINAAILWFFPRAILNRLTTKWQQEGAEQIELLKGEINKNQSLSENLLKVYSTGHNFAQQKRIETIEVLWKGVQKNGAFSASTSLVYSYMTDNEIINVYKDPKIGNPTVLENFKKLSLEKFVEKTASSVIEAGALRPFISSRLWELYKLHGLFIGRSTVLLTKDKQDKKTTLWKNDTMIHETLSGSLTEDEINAAKSMKFGSYNHIVNLIESKILIECNLILSGESAMESSMEIAGKLDKLRNLENKTSNSLSGLLD